jgi:hypothetical protein
MITTNLCFLKILMIIKRFFKVNTSEKIIFKLNIKFLYENLGLFVTFYMNLHTRSQAKKLRLRQNVAAPPTPAPQH